MKDWWLIIFQRTHLQIDLAQPVLLPNSIPLGNSKQHQTTLQNLSSCTQPKAYMPATLLHIDSRMAQPLATDPGMLTQGAPKTSPQVTHTANLGPPTNNGAHQSD